MGKTIQQHIDGFEGRQAEAIRALVDPAELIPLVKQSAELNKTLGDPTRDKA